MSYVEPKTAAAGTVLNTGLKSTDPEGKIKVPLFATSAGEFNNVAEMKTLAALKALILDKSVIPWYEAYAAADASTDDEVFEEGNFRYITKDGAEVLQFELYVNVNASEIVKSFENSEYQYILEFTEKKELIGSYASDNIKTRGRKISTVTAQRFRTTSDKPAYVLVEVTFNDKNDIADRVVVNADYGADDIPYVHDLKMVISAATAGGFTATVTEKYTGDSVPGLLISDFVFTSDADGSTQTIALGGETDGVYTFTGSGLVSGKLNTNGVLDKTTILYEGDEAQVTI